STRRGRPRIEIMHVAMIINLDDGKLFGKVVYANGCKLKLDNF
ncbi:hypothetical protein NPIL_659461, partial [Nephila pilipes]